MLRFMALITLNSGEYSSLLKYVFKWMNYESTKQASNSNKPVVSGIEVELLII